MPCVDCLEQKKILVRLTNALSDQELKCQDLEKKLQKANLKNKARLLHYKDQFLEKSNSKESEIIENLLFKLEDLTQQVGSLEEENGEIKRENNILDAKIRDLKSKNEEHGVQILPEGIQENVYSQIMYKDAKIMDLSKIIDEKDKRIMDLQEGGKERDEVLKAKTKAIQILQQQLQTFTNRKFCDRATDCDSNISNNIGSGPEDKYSPGGAVAFYREVYQKDDECSSFTTELTFNDSITEPVKNIEKLNTRLSGLLEQVETMQKKVVNKQDENSSSLSLLVDDAGFPITAVKKKREKKVKFDLSDKEKDGRIQDLEEKLQRSELFCEDLREENEDLRFTIADLERRLGETDVNLNAREKEVSDQRQKIDKIENELAESKNQLNDSKINFLKIKAHNASRIKEVESKIENLKISDSTLRQKLEKCQEFEGKNSRLEIRMLDLEDKLKFADQKFQIKNENCENLIQQLHFVKSGFEEFKSQSENIVLEFETEMEKLNVENLNLKNQILNLKCENENFISENSRLFDDKENLLADLNQLREAMEISNEFIDFLENQGQIKFDDQDQNFSRQNSEYRLKFKAYMTKMTVLEKENEKLEDEVTKISDLLENSQVYCINLSNDLTSLKKELDVEKWQRSALEKNLKDIKSTCDRTTCDSTKSYLSKIEELQNLLDEKANELQSILSTNQRSNDSQFCQLRRDFEKQNEENQILKHQFQQSMDEKSEIELELSKLWNQDAASKKALSDMEREYCKILQEKSTLEKINEEQCKILQDLKSKIIDQENLMQKIRFCDNNDFTTPEILKHQIDGFENENLLLKNQIEGLQNRCRTLNVDIQNLKSDFSQANKSLIDERERNIDLHDQLQQSNARFLEMENSTETLLGIITDKETNLNQLHSKLEYLEFQLRNLEDEKLNLTSQIDCQNHLFFDLVENLQNLELKIRNLAEFSEENVSIFDKNQNHETILNLKKSNDDLRSEFRSEIESLSNFNRVLSDNLEKLRNLSISNDREKNRLTEENRSLLNDLNSKHQKQCSYEELQAYYAQLQNAYASLYEQYENMTSSATVVQDQCTSLVNVDLNAEFSPVSQDEQVSLDPASPENHYAQAVTTSYINGAMSIDQCSYIVENLVQLVQSKEFKHLTNVTLAEKLIFVQNHVNKLVLENSSLQKLQKSSTNEIYGLSQHVEILSKELDSAKEICANERHVKQNLQRNCDQLNDTDKLLSEEISALKSLCKRLDEQKMELECKLRKENSTLHHEDKLEIEQEIRQILNEICDSNSIDLLEHCKVVRRFFNENAEEISNLKSSCKQLDEEKRALECKLREENLTLHQEEKFKIEREIRQILSEICDSNSIDLLEHCKIVRRFFNENAEEISTLKSLCKQLDEGKGALECKLREQNSNLHLKKNAEISKNLEQEIGQIRENNDDLKFEISIKNSEILEYRRNLLSLKNQLKIHENDLKIFDSQIIDFLNEKLWKIDEMIAQCQDADQKSRKIKIDNEKLKSELSILEHQNRSLILELDQTKKKLDSIQFDLNLKSQQVENQNSKIDNLNDEFLTKIQILNEQIRMLESVNSMSKNEDDAARLLIESREKDLIIWKNRYHDLEIRFDDQKSQLSMNEDRIQELESMIFEKKTQFRNALVQCSLNQDLETKNQNLMTQLQNLEEKCSKNSEKFQEITSFIDENEILSEFKHENEGLIVEIRKLKGENQILVDGTLKIESEFKLVKSEYQQRFDQVAQDAKTMQEENERLLNLNAASNLNIAKYVQEIHDLKTQLIELRTICDNLQTSAQNSQFEKEKMEKMNVELKKEKSISDDQCRQFRDQLKILERNRKSESSTSNQLKTATNDAKALIESLEKERSTNNVCAKELLDLKAQLAYSESQLDDFRIKLIDSESSHRTIKVLRSKLQEISGEKARLLKDCSTSKADLQQKIKNEEVSTAKNIEIAENLEIFEKFPASDDSQEPEIRSSSDEIAFVSCSSSSSDSLVRRRKFRLQ